MTLSELLSERAKKYSTATCIKYEDRKLSYSELDALVSIAAGGLVSVGIGHEEPVAILMENCPEYIILYFAVLRAGGTVVPVNTFFTPDEVSYILNDCGCKILLYSGRYSSHAEKITGGIRGLKALSYNEIPQTKKAYVKGEDEDIAVLLYTSGTTGFPKGAMLSHKNLISNVEAIMKVIPLSGADRILLFLPLFHSFSFTVCVLLPIYAGARIILLKSVKPFSKVINSIFRDRITLFVAIPTVYNILSKKKIPFPVKYLLRFILNIRACVSGAAALPEGTIHAFEERFNIPLIEGYGLTEASPVVSVNPLNGVRKPASVGPALPGINARVVSEDGRTTKCGEVGELIVRGPNVMKGYFNNKEETEAVLKEGWLYTGDLAKIDEDGYIYIVDRKKDLIIIGGMNIYPKEVEDIVLKHPLVEECSMVGIPDGKGSEISVLYVKGKEAAVVVENEIRDYLKHKVAQFKVPRRIIFIDEFPKTATGKIRKTELRKWKL